MTMEEAWREWAAKHRPQNEEGFWICFKDAWKACEDEHKPTIELLKQEVHWALGGYIRKDDHGTTSR